MTDFEVSKETSPLNGDFFVGQIGDISLSITKFGDSSGYTKIFLSV